MQVTEILQRYVDERYPDFIDVVLTDVNQHGAFGNTPLHIASMRGALNEIETLLAAGAKADAEGEMGDRPLHNAAMRGHGPVVKRLLEAGASPEVKDDHGFTPRSLAVSLGHHDVVAIIDSWIDYGDHKTNR
jgi:ankyrin repeat protein